MPKRNSIPRPHRIASLGLTALLFLSLGLDPAHGENDAVLRSVAAVRNLPIEDAQKALPVELTAQVTLLGHKQLGGFIQDETRGIYLALDNSIAFPEGTRPGSMIQITGLTDPGDFIPHILATKVTLLKHVPLPDAPDLERMQLLQPDLDCQRVQFTGILLEVSDFPNRPYLFIKLWWQSEILLVKVLKTDGIRRHLQELIHRKLKISAIAATKGNNLRQMTNRYFQIHSLEELIPLDLDPAHAAPLGRNLQGNSLSQHAVTVRGIVTRSSAKSTYLRAEHSSILVRLPIDQEFKPGTEIQALGYAIAKPFGPELLASSLQALGNKPPPAAIQFPHATQVYDTRFHHELIKLKATLLSIGSGGDITTLYCKDGDLHFEALFPTRKSLPPHLLPGCELEITAVCELQSSEPVAFSRDSADRFQLRIIGLEDLAIIKSPPWWTMRRMLMGIGIISILSFTALAWGISLRRRVAHQTAIISDQIEKQAALSERQHLARELHDTLQQNLTGISMQVDHAQSRIEANEHHTGQELLKQVQTLISECQVETREAITSLRSANSIRGSLAVFLEDSLREKARMADVKFEVRTIGQPQPYDSFAVRHILRICREAFTNAIHHSHPHTVSLIFDYQQDQLVVTIADDGNGFDPKTTDTPGHYGLLGMRERAELIGAVLRIQSSTNAGTSITLAIPASPHLETST